jgi:hypothetical protein
VAHAAVAGAGVAYGAVAAADVAYGAAAGAVVAHGAVAGAVVAHAAVDGAVVAGRELPKHNARRVDCLRHVFCITCFVSRVLCHVFRGVSDEIEA